MFKTALPALAAMLLVVSSAKADDSLEFDLANISDADITIEEVDFDVDMDALEADADDGLMSGQGDELEEAIGACFRRFGYGYRGYRGYRHFGGYYGRSCYRPIYRSYCYNTYSYCRPVYNYCAPIYRSYWGCH